MTFDKWCEGTGKTNKAIAPMFDIHPNYVGMLRRGERNISLTLADTICVVTKGAVPLESWLKK